MSADSTRTDTAQPGQPPDWLHLSGVGAIPVSAEPSASPADSSAPTGSYDPRISEPETTTQYGPRPVPPRLVRLPDVAGYAIERELGRGGMGVVYLARQIGLDRRVALKMILASAHAGPETLARFRTEAQAVAQLQHPNIVQIFEVGEHDGQPFCALEYVAGGSLAHYLAKQPQPLMDAAWVVEQLARAIQVAHDHDIVHRDLKPANILLAMEDGRRPNAAASHPQVAIENLQSVLPKITDFGLAKRLDDDSGQTRTGDILGTPSYMAPEQAEGHNREVGPAADIYALGAILYEMLTGRPPFLGLTPTDTILQVVADDPVPPRRLIARMPSDLETICLQCLRKEPQRRYRTAGELADDLRRFRQDEPIRARPVRVTERWWRWCRRNPLAAGLAASVALLLLVLGTGGPLLAWQQAELRASADSLRAEAEESARVANEQTVAAKSAEAKATKQLKEREAFGEFLVQDVLAAARPRAPTDVGLGKDVTIAEALDAALPKLERHFAGMPATEASVRQAFGMTYQMLGNYPAAKAQLERATALFTQELGPDHLKTIGARANLAALLLGWGKFVEAEPLLRQALADVQRASGPEDGHALMIQGNLVSLLVSQGRMAEAEPLARATLELQDRVFGPHRSATLRTQTNLVSILRSQGKTREAEQLLRQTLETAQRELGPEHPDTLVAQHELVNLLLAQRRLGEAAPLAREVVDIRKRVLGSEHPYTLDSQANLAHVLAEQGQLADAEQLCRAALEGKRRVMGGDDTTTLTMQGNLATILSDQGKLAEAATITRATLDLMRRLKGPRHADTLLTQNNLGVMLHDLGQFAEAEQMLRAAWTGRREVLGPEHQDTLFSQLWLAIALEKQAKAKEAETNYREALAGCRRHLGPMHSQTISTQRDLGQFLVDYGDPAEAAPLLREVAAVYRRQLPATRVALANTLNGLGRAFTESGQAAEAEPVIREALALRKEAFPTGHFAIALSEGVLGQCLAAQRKYAEAEPLIVGSQVVIAKAPLPLLRKKQAVERVIRLYEAWGKKAEADQWRKALEELQFSGPTADKP